MTLPKHKKPTQIIVLFLASDTQMFVGAVDVRPWVSCSTQSHCRPDVECQMDNTFEKVIDIGVCNALSPDIFMKVRD